MLPVQSWLWQKASCTAHRLTEAALFVLHTRCTIFLDAAGCELRCGTQMPDDPFAAPRAAGRVPSGVAQAVFIDLRLKQAKP